MNAKEAVAKRIQGLCAEHDLAINALANQAGISWRCHPTEAMRWNRNHPSGIF